MRPSRPRNRRRGAWPLRENAENYIREKHTVPLQGVCLSLVRCPTVFSLPPSDGGGRDLSQVHSPFALIPTRYFARIQPLGGRRGPVAGTRSPLGTPALAPEPEIARLRSAGTRRPYAENRGNAALRLLYSVRDNTPRASYLSVLTLLTVAR